MLVEFEKRIAMHEAALEDLKKRGLVNDSAAEKVRGQLEECEKLRAFYMTQMVDKGRIIPEAQNGGS